MLNGFTTQPPRAGPRAPILIALIASDDILIAAQSWSARADLLMALIASDDILIVSIIRSVRAMTVLLGAHVSSASPLAKLTPDLVRLILELVRRDCRTHVVLEHVVLETAPEAGLPLHAPTVGGVPLQTPPPTFAGADLASVAQMLA
jgi:hypothetical protein